MIRKRYHAHILNLECCFSAVSKPILYVERLVPTFFLSDPKKSRHAGSQSIFGWAYSGQAFLVFSDIPSNTSRGKRRKKGKIGVVALLSCSSLLLLGDRRSVTQSAGPFASTKSALIFHFLFRLFFSAPVCAGFRCLLFAAEQPRSFRWSSLLRFF